MPGWYPPEYAAITGHHRKHAGRLLRRGLAPQERPRRARQIYDAAVLRVVEARWPDSRSAFWKPG
ncbi:hypothetical protein ACFQU7_38825 [Pseudoroseomonas wenyumeiae]